MRFAQSYVTNEQARHIREVVRLNLGLPEDFPVAVLSQEIDITVTSDPAVAARTD